MGVDDEIYLCGIQIFIEAQSQYRLESAGLRSAAFWVGIRQEIHTAFLEQRGIRFNLSCPRLSSYRSLDPTDDSTWANRVILHCADVLTYCYGEEIPIVDRYDQLLGYSQGWLTSKPPTFSPIYYKSPSQSDEGMFPQIWYLGDCQGKAIPF